MNGTLERAHGTMKKTLDKLGYSTANLDEYLAPTLMALRTVPHSALGVTPFHLMFGMQRGQDPSECSKRQHDPEEEDA